MKKLILVRHGDYVDSELTRFGRIQMQELGLALASSLVGNTLLVSSTIQRAKESAAILAEHFQLSVKEHPVWAAPDRESDNEGALKFVTAIDTTIDTLVVVTHLPFLQSFPNYYSERVLKRSLPYGGVDKGQAQVIDCEAKTMTRIAPTLE